MEKTFSGRRSSECKGPEAGTRMSVGRPAGTPGSDVASGRRWKDDPRVWPYPHVILIGKAHPVLNGTLKVTSGAFSVLRFSSSIYL